jgi:hypothetical protein
VPRHGAADPGTDMPVYSFWLVCRSVPADSAGARCCLASASVNASVASTLSMVGLRGRNERVDKTLGVDPEVGGHGSHVGTDFHPDVALFLADHRSFSSTVCTGLWPPEATPTCRLKAANGVLAPNTF